MAEERIAEFVLRVVCGGGRASEIVGDLCEEGRGRGIALWWAVLTVLFQVSWRYGAAGIAILLSEVYLTGLYAFKFRVTLAHDHSAMRWAGPCLAVSLWLLSVTILNSFRYGWRDRLTIIALLPSLLFGAAALEAADSHLRLMATVLAFGVMGVCIARTKLRGAALGMLLSFFAHAGTLLLCGYAASKMPALNVLHLAYFLVGWTMSVVFGMWTLQQTRKRFMPA